MTKKRTTEEIEATLKYRIALARQLEGQLTCYRCDRMNPTRLNNGMRLDLMHAPPAFVCDRCGATVTIAEVADVYEQQIMKQKKEVERIEKLRDAIIVPKSNVIDLRPGIRKIILDATKEVKSDD